MLVAILQFDLLVHDAQSLKDKRRVVSSIKARLHQDHLAAVAEVGHQEMLNIARMGLALVGSDAKHLAQTLDRITLKIREWAAPDAELGDASRVILHADQIEALGLREGAMAGDVGVADDQDIAHELLTRGESALRQIEAERDRGVLPGAFPPGPRAPGSTP
jgi:uncharacterized protein